MHLNAGVKQSKAWIDVDPRDSWQPRDGDLKGNQGGGVVAVMGGEGDGGWGGAKNNTHT